MWKDFILYVMVQNIIVNLLAKTRQIKNKLFMEFELI